MGKSVKRTPIGGWTTASSEKQDKQIANRRFRRAIKVAIENEREPIFDIKQVSNVWAFAKDGKGYYSKSTIEKYPQLMRK